jgi:hypothetical protein
MGLALGAALFFGTPSAQADVPGGFTYQGLLEENGLPLPDGTVTLTITLIDQSTSSPIYTETIPSVTVAGGIFNVVIGGATAPFPAGVTFNSQYLMQVVVSTPGGLTTLAPTELWSAPYAVNAGAVNGIQASPVPVAGDLFPVPIGAGYEGTAKLDPGFLPKGIPNNLLATGTIETINGISPDANGNFQLIAGTGIALVPGTNSLTINGSSSGVTSVTAGGGLVENGQTGNVSISIGPGAITGQMIPPGAVTGQKISGIAGIGLLQDAAGLLDINVDNSTIGVTAVANGNYLYVLPGGIGSTQLANGSVTNAKLQNSTIGATSNGSINLGGWPVSLGGSGSISLNTANANTWTVGQNFNGITNTGGISTGTLTSTGNITDGGNLTVAGTSTLGATTVGALTTTSITNSGAISTGTLTSTGNITDGGTLSTGGNITDGGTLSTAGNITDNGNLTVGGTTNLTGNTTVVGSLTTNGITNTGAISTTGNITSTTGNITATTGNLTAGGNLSVGGNSTLTGNATVGGTLTVTGLFTVNGIQDNGILNSTGNSNIGSGANTVNTFGNNSGDVNSIGTGIGAVNTIGASGGSNTINGTNTVNGNSTFNGTAAFGANNVSGSNFTITGGTINNTSVGATTPSTGAFTTLSSSGNSNIATGSGLTNTFGNGTGATNTIGGGTGTTNNIGVGPSTTNTIGYGDDNLAETGNFAVNDLNGKVVIDGGSTTDGTKLVVDGVPTLVGAVPSGGYEVVVNGDVNVSGTFTTNAFSATTIEAQNGYFHNLGGFVPGTPINVVDDILGSYAAPAAAGVPGTGLATHMNNVIIGNTVPAAAWFTTLASSGNTTLATGAGTTNTFGAGSGAINTFGNSTGTNAINGTTNVTGATNINTTGTALTTIGAGANQTWLDINGVVTAWAGAGTLPAAPFALNNFEAVITGDEEVTGTIYSATVDAGNVWAALLSAPNIAFNNAQSYTANTSMTFNVNGNTTQPTITVNGPSVSGLYAEQVNGGAAAGSNGVQITGGAGGGGTGLNIDPFGTGIAINATTTGINITGATTSITASSLITTLTNVNAGGTAGGTTGVFSIGGNTVLSDAGSTTNILGGVGAGSGSTGAENTYYGNNAGNSTGAGNLNVATGYYANYDNGSSNNTSTGAYAGYFSAGNDNVYEGYTSGYDDGGSNNTRIGYQNFAFTSSSNATSIGSGAAASGGNSTALGQGSTASASNSTALGSGASVSTANEIQLGNTSVTLVHTSGSYTALAQGSLLGQAANSGTALTVANNGASNALVVTGGEQINGTGAQNSLTFNTTGGATYDVTGTGNTWNVSPTGSANFTHIGLATPGTGAFTTLTSSGASTIGTGAGLTNTFGAGANATNSFGTGTSAANTIGNSGGTNAINGSNTVLGNTTINTTGNFTTAIGNPGTSNWWITSAGAADFGVSMSSPSIFFNTAEAFTAANTMQFTGTGNTNPVISIGTIGAAQYGELIATAGATGGIQITGTSATGVNYQGTTGTAFNDITATTGTGLNYVGTTGTGVSAAGTTGTGVLAVESGAGMGVQARVNGAGAYTGAAGSVAIVGLQNTAAGLTAGVMGLNGVTVASTDAIAAGVYGESNQSTSEGVGGVSSSTGPSGAGVVGKATGATANRYGVFGAYYPGAATNDYGVIGTTSDSWAQATTIVNAANMGYSDQASVFAVAADNTANGGTALRAQANGGGNVTAISATATTNAGNNAVAGAFNAAGGGASITGISASVDGSGTTSNIGANITSSGNGSIGVNVTSGANTGVQVDASVATGNGVLVNNVLSNSNGVNVNFNNAVTSAIGVNVNMINGTGGTNAGLRVQNVNSATSEGALIEMTAGTGTDVRMGGAGTGSIIEGVGAATGESITGITGGTGIDVSPSVSGIGIIAEGTGSTATVALEVGNAATGVGGNVVSGGNANNGTVGNPQNGWTDTYVLQPADQANGVTEIQIYNSLVRSNSSILITVEASTAGPNGLVSVGNDVPDASGFNTGHFDVYTTAAQFGTGVFKIHYQIVNH